MTQVPETTCRILLVDDDRDAYMLVRAHLGRVSGIDYDVTWVPSYDEGLAAIRRRSHDVYFIDYQLAGQSGIDLIRRAIADGCTAPLILFTSEGDRRVDREAIAAGAADYLDKGELTTRSLERAVRHGITRKAAEAELRQREEYFRRLIENDFALVAVTDAETNVRYISPAAHRIVGYPPAELQGRSLFAHTHPDDMAAVHDLTAVLLSEAGNAVSFDMRILHRDGTSRIVEVVAKNLLREPAVGGLLFNARDITESRRASERLYRREQALKALVENTPDVITRVDHNVRHVFVNPAIERAMGLLPDNVLGRPHAELALPADVAAQWRDSTAKVFETKHESSLSFSLPTTMSGTRWFETRLVPELAPDGSVASVLSISRDVTDQRQLEEQYRQSQKMEAVGKLAGGIAHDFNNILTAIQGHAQMLIDELDDPRVKADALEISRSAERAAALTRQLLAFSRKQVLQPRLLDANDVVRNVRRMLERLIGEHIDLQTELVDEPLQVRADPGQLEQVLINLVVNARDALPRGGTITIQTRSLTLQSKHVALELPAGRYMQIGVIDSGIGMSEDTLARAFDPFFTTKPAGQGTGLGLSTAYGIVRQSGGSIEATSSPGAGTKMYVYLPVAEDAQADRNAAAGAGGTETGSNSRSATILVVEDEGAVRSLAVRCLKRAGYQVLAAADPLEALDIFEVGADQLDLVLTDIVMPHMNGRVLAEQMLKRRPDLRVLFMSGYTQDVLSEGGPSEIPLIEKPFTPQELVERIRAELARVPVSR